MFDRSGTGYIGTSDLRAVLQCIGEDLDEEESELVSKQYEQNLF